LFGSTATATPEIPPAPVMELIAFRLKEPKATETHEINRGS
jgi:hypothetical protein